MSMSETDIPKPDNRGVHAEKIHINDYARLPSNKAHPRGVNALVFGIVKKAAFDYKHGSPYWKGDAENFFRSDWFNMLTNIDGKFMLTLLERYDVTKMPDSVDVLL